MKRLLLVAGILGVCGLSACERQKVSGCFVGAFLADRPSAADIDRFQASYGKKPGLILTFLDWGKYPDEGMVRAVSGRGVSLMVTWEPWVASTQAGIDYDAFLAGKDDAYIRAFALKMKALGQPVFLRFAHEMNGDWYPWSCVRISPEKYQKLWFHARRIFDQVEAGNVRWVFSLNSENVPLGNDAAFCYPGDRYVDYIGLDGYNWGTTRTGSRWQSFNDIFFRSYKNVLHYKKPVILSEFSSTSSGGDKALWIEKALCDIRRMSAVKGFILFNVDKETDWRFSSDTESGRRLKRGLKSPYFVETLQGSLR